MSTDEIPSARMIRAARGLLGLDQSQLAEIVGVDRRTIIRIEADDNEPVNPRRREVHASIKQRLETDYGVRFVFGGKSGEGVVMKRGN